MEIKLTSTDVRKMDDDELSAIAGLPELVKAAKAERERREIEADPDSMFGHVCITSTRYTTEAACPTCGSHDSVLETKAMYSTGFLARGGEPVGTAAYCSCGDVYDARTGKRLKPGRDFYSY